MAVRPTARANNTHRYNNAQTSATTLIDEKRRNLTFQRSSVCLHILRKSPSLVIMYLKHMQTYPASAKTVEFDVRAHVKTN